MIGRRESAAQTHEAPLASDLRVVPESPLVQATIPDDSPFLFWGWSGGDPSFVNRPLKIGNHSCLNAAIGSTFVARWAGRKLARSATVARSSDTAMNVPGSPGLTPNSRLRNS